MKKMTTLCLVLLALFAATATLSAAGPDFDASKFPAWVENEGVWRTVNTTSFKMGAQYAPTDAQLKTIMRLTSLSPTSVGMTDYLLVVLKDPAQQIDVVGKDKAGPGTVTVMVFGDRLIATDKSLGKHTQQLDRGYYNAGIVSGYLNLAALSQGFGTHFYMTSQYATAGARPVSIEEAYLKDKGYKYSFGYDPYKRGDANKQAEAWGNLKWICAIVIGTLDETAQTKVTDHGYPENWVVAK